MTSLAVLGDRGDVSLVPAWRRATLRELCSGTLLLDPAKSPEQEFEYVDVSSVSAESLRITGTTKVKGSAAPSRARKLLQAEDVIFATVRPTLRRVARVPPSFDGQLASTAFCVIRANPDMADPSFLYYAVITDDFLGSVGALQRGASYPAVADSDVLGQEILVPPLREQRAIGGVLRAIQATVEIQDRMVAKLKELKSATMAKLFREGLRGEPLKKSEIGHVPQSWRIERIGDLFDIQLGKMLSGKARLGKAPRPYLRNANVRWGRIDLSDLYEMDFSEKERQKFALRPGDILVCEGGEPGRTAIWSGELPECYYQKALHRLRPKDTRPVLPEFFAYWAMAAFLVLKTHGEPATKTTIAHLPAVELGRTAMPVPALEEQKEFVRILDGIGAAERMAEDRRARLAGLFSVMLHSLTTAQVRLPAFVERNDLETSGERGA